ncbi:MAG: hypothetical protein QM756_39090 [Polyangiaceae bacterium]
MRHVAWWLAGAALCVACIDVGHDAEVGCLADMTEPGCHASGGVTARGGAGGASSKGGAASGGAKSGGAASVAGAAPAQAGEGGGG